MIKTAHEYFKAPPNHYVDLAILNLSPIYFADRPEPASIATVDSAIFSTVCNIFYND